MSTNGSNSQLFKIILGIASVLLAVITSFVAGKTLDHTVSISTIENTRFTQQDGYNMRTDMLKEHNDIRRELVSTIQEIKDCIIRVQHDEECE